MKTTTFQTKAAMSALFQWAARDLAGAKAWTDCFPPGPLRERAQNELAAMTARQQDEGISFLRP